MCNLPAQHAAYVPIPCLTTGLPYLSFPFAPLRPQTEIDKQAAVIRDLNDRVKRAAATPKASQVRVKVILHWKAASSYVGGASRSQGVPDERQAT